MQTLTLLLQASLRKAYTFNFCTLSSWVTLFSRFSPVFWFISAWATSSPFFSELGNRLCEGDLLERPAQGHLAKWIKSFFRHLKIWSSSSKLPVSERNFAFTCTYPEVLMTVKEIPVQLQYFKIYIPFTLLNIFNPAASMCCTANIS